jgi:outer membrane protein TolC
MKLRDRSSGLLFILLATVLVFPAVGFPTEREKKKDAPSKKLILKAEAVEKKEAPPSSTALPLTLQDVIERSLRSNVTIMVFSFDPRIKFEDIANQNAAFDPSLGLYMGADQSATQASSAFAFPNVSENKNKKWEASLTQKLALGTQYQFSWINKKNDTNSIFAGLNPQYNTDLKLGFTQPLLKSFGIDINKSNVYIAQNNAKISANDFRQKVIDIVTDTETAYWDVVFSIEDLRVKEKSLERALDLQRRVKAQVDVGTMAPLEILQAKAEVASIQEGLITAKDTIKDNEDKLKNILNIPFDSDDGKKTILPLDPAEVVDVDIPEFDEALALALKQRPDYGSKKKDLENKKILVKFNENQLYPSLDLVGSMGLNGISGDAQAIRNASGVAGKSPFGGSYADSIDNLFKTDYHSWEAGLRLTYPLGNRAAQSQITVAKLNVQKLLYDLKDLEKKIVVEVREALRQLNTDAQRVEATHVSRKYAEEKLAAEDKKFKVGLSTSFTVLQFQEDLAKEQSKELQAIIDFNKSKIRMRKALATTLEDHHIEMANRNGNGK